MADGRGSKIGETYVEVGAKITGLQEGMKQAEAETRKTASKMNEAFGTVGRGGTFDGISKGIKDSTAGVRNLLSAVVGVVGAFTRMLGLVGLISTAVAAVALGAKQVWDYFTGAADEAERVQKNMEDAAKAYERYVARVAAAAKSLPSPIPNLGATPAEIDALDKQIARKATYLRQVNNTISAETRQKYIDELAALELKRQQIQAASARAQEIERQNEAKAAEDAIEKARLAEIKAAEDLAKRVAQIDAETRQLNRESMDEKDRLTDEYNEKWDAIYKRMQDAKDSAEKAALQKLLDATTARYGDEYRAFERLEREKTEAANAEAEKRQKAEGERMSKMAASYGAELSKAFQSADSANRAASDAMMERMATSINRLKEIAESNKQATNRGDTSTAGGVW